MTYPGGVTRRRAPKGTVTFGAACPGCPLREQCTTSASGRAVALGEHHQLQRQHRERVTDEGFQTVYRQHRPLVERSLAWLPAGTGACPTGGGVAKNNTRLHHRVAAPNLRRLLALGQPQWHLDPGLSPSPGPRRPEPSIIADHR